MRSFYAARERFPGIDCGGESASCTKQEFHSECNINTIMAKYERDGSIDHVRDRDGDYGDFSEIVDYQSACNSVIDAQEAFAGLPARLREAHGNDPARFLAWFDEASEDDLREAALLPPKEVKVADVVPVAATEEPKAAPTGSGEPSEPAGPVST